MKTHMKMETHRHLGGCISSQFVWDIIKAQNLHYLAETYDDVVKAMTFTKDELYGFQRFLNKFKILDEINWTEELIDKSIAFICADLEAEQIDYVLIDFSINKYMDIGWHRIDAIKFVYDSFQKHRPHKVGLILSLKYESPKVSQKQFSKLILHPDTANLLAGIDLVGEESVYDANFYEPLFKDWNKLGKITRAHAGESQSVDNIESAITKLHVNRIAHGIKIVESDRIIKLAKENDVIFDLAITSNYLTGVVSKDIKHPIFEMVNSGLKVTIGTDDPVQCGVTLDSEFDLLESMGFEDFHKIINYYGRPKISTPQYLW